MDEERLDLSALDPARDPDRWRATVDATLARVDGVLRERERRRGPLAEIAGWTRPLLAAAAVATAILLPAHAALERHVDRREQVRGLVALSTDWARGEHRPTGADLLRAVHRGDEP